MIVALVLLLFAAYGNSLRIPFILDDDLNITDNLAIRDLGGRDAWVPPASSGLGGRPLLSLTFALNYAAHGLWLPGFHAVNLAIFGVAVLAVYGCVRRTLLWPGVRERFGADAWWIALAVAALWAVHPLNTISVSYLSQRAESLAAMCSLTALYCFIRGLQSPRGAGWFAGSVLACLAGAMTKEVAVVTPFLLLTYDRTFVSGGYWAALRKRWRVFVPLFATCVWVVQSTHDVGDRGAGYGFGITWWSYALVSCRAVVTYLRLIVCPAPLVVDYGRFAVTYDTTTAAYAIAVVVLVGIGLWAFVRHPRIGFLAAWFFVVLAPTTSVVPIASAPIGENRPFLVIPAVLCALVLLLRHLLAARSGWVIATLVLVGGALTVQRNTVFATDLSLWRDATAKRPDNARAWTNLGHALQLRGEQVEAGVAMQRACELDPKNSQAHANLGGWLVAQGRLAEAVAAYERALKIHVGRAHYWTGLGQANFALGRLEAAGIAFGNAIALEPRRASSRHNLGCWFAAQGRMAEARTEFETALRLEPTFSPAREALARLGPAAPAPVAP